jgi:hypothetical protein
MFRTHIVRTYTRSGYTLYAGVPRNGFASAALGVVSASISREFLQLEGRIEDLLESGRISWTVSFQNDGGHRPLLVAYSGYINVQTARRTEPIAFLHTLELESPSYLVACVEGVVKALSVEGIYRLHMDLRALALDGADEQELLKRLTSRFETLCDPTRVAPRSRNGNAPGTIVHDCAGGPAIAWLTMAAAQAHAPGPWIVADELDRNGGVQTRCIPDYGRTSVLASELMFHTMSAEEDVRVETPKYFSPDEPLLTQPPTRDEIRGEPPLAATKRSLPRATRLPFAVLLPSFIFSVAAFVMSLWVYRHFAPVAGYKVNQSADRAAVTALAASREAMRMIDGVSRRVDVLTLQSLIDSAALGDDSERKAAMRELDSRLSDPRIVNIILQRATHFRVFEQRVPLMRVTGILLHVPAQVLAKDKDEVSALAQSIANNGTQSRTVATDLLARLSQTDNK